METIAAGSNRSHAEEQRAAARRLRSGPWLWMTLALAVAAVIWIQGPRLTDPYSVEEDMRSFPWLHRFRDPQLFSGDPMYGDDLKRVRIGAYSLLIYPSSPGYSLLVELGSTFVPPVLFTKLLAFPLMLLAVYYLFGIGRKLAGPGTAFALCLAYVIFNLASPTAISATGGLQRSFMLPLLLALIYYLMAARSWAAAIVVFASGTIYPPAAFLGAATYGLSLLQKDGKGWLPVIRREASVPLIVAVTLVALVLLPTLTGQVGRAVAGTTAGSHESLLSDVTYQAGGRRALFKDGLMVGRAGLANDGSTALHIFFLTLPALVTFWLQPKTLYRFPYLLKLLFLASIYCFAAAWAAMLLTNSFALYLPSRYTQASLPLFLLIYVVVNTEATLERITTWLYRQRAKSFLLLVPVALVTAAIALFGPEAQTGFQAAFIFRHRQPLLLLLSAALLGLGFLSVLRARANDDHENEGSAPRSSEKGAAIFGGALLVPALFYVWAFHAVFHVATPVERQLYQYLEMLPKDVRMGGDPQTLSSVPIFAKRAVLFSEEDPHPDGEVMMEAMRAYYAESLVDVVAFCRRHEVDYLLVNGHDFEAERIARGKYLFEPYDSMLSEQLAGRTRFVLANVSQEAKRFESGDLTVVDCHELAR